MSRSRPRLTRVVLIALGLGLLVGGWALLFERVPQTQRLPPGPETRSNPLHALTLALRAEGQTVQLKGHLDLDRTPPPVDSSLVLLYPEAQVETEAAASRLFAWVQDGGRLLLPMPQAEAAPALSAHIEDALGVRALRGAAAVGRCPTPSLAGHVLPEPVCGTPFVVDADLALADLQAVWPRREAARLARFALGEGEVWVFSELALLENPPFLPRLDATPLPAAMEAEAARDRIASARIAAVLAAPLLEGGEVWLVAYRGGSLWALIVREGWPALLGVGLALLAWGLWRSARLGPVPPSPSPHRRALMAHIDAAGQFAFRSDHGLALHAAVRDALLDRLAQRHALARLDEATLASTLADRGGLPREAVAAALAPPVRATPEQFRHAIALLSTLLQRL